LKKQVQDIIFKWIAGVKKKYEIYKNISRIKKLWLLLDYSGNDFSPEFYQEHAGEAIATLNMLDDRKPDVLTVKKYLQPIIEEHMRSAF
jgi:hypothetical protein